MKMIYVIYYNNIKNNKMILDEFLLFNLRITWFSSDFYQQGVLCVCVCVCVPLYLRLYAVNFNGIVLFFSFFFILYWGRK